MAHVFTSLFDLTTTSPSGAIATATPAPVATGYVLTNVYETFGYKYNIWETAAVSSAFTLVYLAVLGIVAATIRYFWLKRKATQKPQLREQTILPSVVVPSHSHRDSLPSYHTKPAEFVAVSVVGGPTVDIDEKRALNPEAARLGMI
ncbi:hypothetical protein BT69DRAFT_1316986 [Atractiella rhizophila]|nr:hypothetical protein BT69DRAFT_1316986 [Atractiella rhizophila]